MFKTTIVSFLMCIVIASQAYGFCFEDAGKEYGVDPMVLWSIAKTESNFNPWAINYNSNGSYDFGLMQINSSWFNKLGGDLWQRLAEPCTNVRVGAWVLAGCIQRYGDTWRAIGCYNANSETKRGRYAWKIYHAMR